MKLVDLHAHRPVVKFSSRSPTLMRIAPGIGSAGSHSPVTDLASSPPRSSSEVLFEVFDRFDSYLEEDGDCAVV